MNECRKEEMRKFITEGLSYNPKIPGCLMCRNLETRCSDCGRLLFTKKLPDSEWVSVKERLPGIDQRIKVKNEKVEVIAQFIQWQEGAIGYYFCCDESGIDSNFKWTHWMPLPPKS